jgi:hypothetical protein
MVFLCFEAPSGSDDQMVIKYLSLAHSSCCLQIGGRGARAEICTATIRGVSIADGKAKWVCKRSFNLALLCPCSKESYSKGC